MNARSWIRSQVLRGVIVPFETAKIIDGDGIGFDASFMDMVLHKRCDNVYVMVIEAFTPGTLNFVNF